MDAGPKIRSYHVLQYLAAAGHRVTLVAFQRVTDRPEDLEHLRQFCEAVHTMPMHRSRSRDAWHLARSLLTGQPFLVIRDWSSAMAGLIRELLATGTGSPQDRFDVIHADQLWMAPYALWARAQSIDQLRLILDQHNAVFQIPQRLAVFQRSPLTRALLRWEARKLIRYEAIACSHFDCVVTVTPEDRDTLATLITKHQGANRPSFVTIPICIDPTAKLPVSRITRPRRVTFLGGLHWPPNAEGILWFAREVWPQVVRQVPDAVLTVLGKEPPAQLVRQATGDPSCELAYYVPDPVPYLAETAVFIVPLHAGGGMRVKIVDAWSWGLPVVSTSIGAEGLNYRNGENLLIANTSEAFAQAVVRVLTDPRLAACLGAAGRHTVEEHYDWHKVYRAWDRVYTGEL
jgi:glycosyltransferase involved in cell wall biosynthesis